MRSEVYVDLSNLGSSFSWIILSHWFKIVIWIHWMKEMKESYYIQHPQLETLFSIHKMEYMIAY